MARAVTPVVAVCLLVALTVLGAAVVGVGVLALETPDETDRLVVSLDVDAGTDRIAMTHRGGDPVNVTTLRITVTVDGEALDRQPPVPFFTASGFRAAPTGPFNRGADPLWRAGERGTVRLASTNAPAIDPGDDVTVTISRNDAVVGRANARAE